jgi:hypothetical protein
MISDSLLTISDAEDNNTMFYKNMKLIGAGIFR